MKPVLIVDGKRYEVDSMTFGYYDENKQYQSIHQSKIENVEYEGRYEPVVDLLRKRIAAHEEVLAEYEGELMNEYQANLKAPFASDKMRTLAEKHTVLSQIIEGLCEAIMIATNEVYLLDDVDLSGGVEDGAMQRVQPF